MKNKNRLLALLLAAGVSGSAGAAQDLLESYRQALAGDPQLAAAQAQHRADSERLVQARSLFLPQVGLRGEYAQVDQSIEYGPVADAQMRLMARPFDERFETHSYGIQLTQPLFRLESFTIYGQAKTLISQADVNLALARQDLGLRVAEAYFGVLRAQNVLQSYQAELTTIERQLARAQKAFEIGAATVTDVNDARARADLVRARQLQADHELRIARETLRRVTGQPVDALAPLAGEFRPQAPQPASSEQWARRAEQENLQVLRAQYGYELAREEVSRQRAQHYPKVDLVASYGRDYQGQVPSFRTDQDAEQARVGVVLTMPLYAGGAISSQVREAGARRDVALEQVRGAQRGASLAAERAYLALESSLLQVRALEQALESIRLNETSTQRGMELGLRTTLDLLNVQRERYAAERDLASARYGYLLAYLQLQAAAGLPLEAEALPAVNAFLE